MPFKKVGKDEYVSPSGRKFTGAQVRLYYATNGFATGSSKSKRVKGLGGFSSKEGHKK